MSLRALLLGLGLCWYAPSGVASWWVGTLAGSTENQDVRIQLSREPAEGIVMVKLVSRKHARFAVGRFVGAAVFREREISQEDFLLVASRFFSWFYREKPLAVTGNFCSNLISVTARTREAVTLSEGICLDPLSSAARRELVSWYRGVNALP